MSWTTELQQVITNPQALCDALKLKTDDLNLHAKHPHSFPLRVPHSFVQRMTSGNPDDPLLRQVLVNADEDHLTPGFSTDPLAEKNASPIPGMLHKYHDRVLLMPSSHCAVHCRYCFRRHYPYDEHALAKKNWSQWWEYLHANPQIEEVILSGGDPLMLKDSMLSSLCEAITNIPSVQRIRIHTRLPIVIPSRLTPELQSLCNQHRIVLTLHCNHAQELHDATLQTNLKHFKQSGITMLNQSVLLKGVNDTLPDLQALSKGLFQTGVLPYYLHLLDPVQGTSHFAIPEATAIALHQQLQATLSGYLVPKLVREIAGQKHKVLMHG